MDQETPCNDQCYNMDEYDELERFVTDSIAAGAEFLFHQALYDQTLAELCRQHGMPIESMQSFVRNLHVHHAKRTHVSVRKKLPSMIDKYHNNSDDTTIILQLAQECNFSPVQLARLMVEHITQLSHSDCSAFIRTPRIDLLAPTSLSPSAQQQLVEQVQHVLIQDPMYGPRHDQARTLVGIEYEVVLEQALKELGIPFETEDELRDRGVSRTPDTLLKIPVGIQIPKGPNGDLEWRMALFGDPQTHRSNLPQAESYVHRFGPGLLIYWFGHAPLHRLGGQHDDIAVADAAAAVLKLPSGELLTKHSSYQDNHR